MTQPKQTNIHINNTQEITREAHEKQEAHKQQEVRGEKMYDTLPPPYSEFSFNDGSKCSAFERESTSYPLLPRNSAPKREPKSYPLLTKYAFDVENPQYYCSGYFLWCLTEITAVTFSTDFVRLKAIIAEMNPRWAVSPHLQEPGSLFHICTRPIVAELTALVRNLEKSLAGNCWIFVHKKEKELLRRWVFLPAESLRMNLEFVLEMLGRYDCVAKKTLVDDWMPLSPQDLALTLASHARLLHRAGLGKKLESLFEESFNTFREDKGLKDLGRRCCCRLLSDGYQNLGKMLREFDPFGGSRSRLRERQILRTLSLPTAARDRHLFQLPATSARAGSTGAHGSPSGPQSTLTPSARPPPPPPPLPSQAKRSSFGRRKKYISGLAKGKCPSICGGRKVESWRRIPECIDWLDTELLF